MSSPVEVKLRIPGPWSQPKELFDRLPAGCRLTQESLTLPSGIEVGFGAAAPDSQFAHIFRNALRQPATVAEMATVDDYKVNIFLMGPGGAPASAHAMMQAAAVIVQAGGAGVFIDNCTLAHGGENWLALTEDGGPDALSFAFTAIIRGKSDVWTMGLHVLGLRDLIMKRSDIEGGGFDIVDVIRYVCSSDTPVEEGHLVADFDGPRFRTVAEERSEVPAGSPMFNPFGRLRLVSMSDIAEAN